MRVIGLTFLALAALIVNVGTDSVTQKAVKEMLVSPDGQELDMEALRQIAEQLIEINLQAGLFKHGGHRHDQPYTTRTRRAADLAINNYLTVGRQPSTTPFLGLSSACDICASVIDVAGLFLGSNKVWPTVIGLAKQLCPGLTDMSQMACDGYVTTFDPIIRYIFPNLVKMPYTLCGKFLKNLGCGQPDQLHSLWEIGLPAPLTNPVPQPTPSTAPEKDKIKVLHMTDIHIDLEYEVGSPARCMEPMCCRKSSTPFEDPLPESDKAGYWGDYRDCDLSTWTFEEILRELNETHGNDIDMVFISGDLPPHDTWNQSGVVHLEIINYVASKFAEKLPGRPVMFACGNHEAAPVSSYPLQGEPTQFSTQWLWNNLTEVWMQFLDPSIQQATIKKAGFYTTLLKPGWRLISINDNYCLNQNFFLFGRPNITDPYEHLTWLVNILTDAEKKGERVHIIGHVPPGDNDCLQAWSWNYYRIVSRFGHIITGQNFGHIHRDYFTLYYDAETLTEPRGFAFVGPPGTPYYHNNIGFRIYDFDSTTYEMLDHHTYYANIDEANKGGNRDKMTWKLEYSAKQTYGLADLSPASWSLFAKRMQTDVSLFNQYQHHYSLSLGDIREPCGFECRRHRLCEAYQGLSHVPDSWCERWFPSLKSQADQQDSNNRKCSSRFIKRPN